MAPVGTDGASEVTGAAEAVAAPAVAVSVAEVVVDVVLDDEVSDDVDDEDDDEVDEEEEDDEDEEELDLLEVLLFFVDVELVGLTVDMLRSLSSLAVICAFKTPVAFFVLQK
jgi:hypothetical protein